MAEVVIETSQYDPANTANSNPQLVFISDQVGYAFYTSTTGTIEYRKTTNGGSSWGSGVSVTSATSTGRLAVWYDQWTPGDNSGTKIHVVYGSAAADNAYYRSLNTSGDSLGTEVDVTGDCGIWDNGNPGPSVCVATDGDIFVSFLGSSTRDVWRAPTGTTTFASTTATHMDSASNTLQLLPLSSGKVILIEHDASSNILVSRVYDASWDGADTTIDGTVVEDITYGQVFAATLYKSTGDIYIAYNNDADSSTDDLKTALYTGGSWSTKTDVLTNTAGVTSCAIIIDQNNSDAYVVYIRGTAGSSTNVYYKKSTDDLTTWGTETQVNSTADDLNYVFGNAMSTERIYAAWSNNNTGEFLGNTVADITPPATNPIGRTVFLRQAAQRASLW